MAREILGQSLQLICSKFYTINNMKTIKRFITVVIAIVAIAGTASAQLSFGIKAGAKIDDFKFENKDYKAPNNLGFTAGLMLEYMFPSTSVGIDASLMYTHTNIKLSEEAHENFFNLVDAGSDFIELPVNFKWKIGLPVARNIVKPYLFTGPSISIFAGRKYLTYQIRKKVVDAYWNLGIGVELFEKVQVGANYGWGLNNTLERSHLDWSDIESRKDSWTITATYIF